ncbi:MAG: infB [Candidatus Kaiserbacteria bacterium]|nr:infB [Candidatus Kaiserbacteria bacterium]
MAKQIPQSIERPPIVVVMGHVDHGKSTLLDFIRKSNIVAGEAGGITQHVAAYEVVREKAGVQKRITFIDTPGHAAFSTIRARGANVADIAILVVAADDGVKAQTLEALAQIREANIPFIVAINKIDKPNADINRTHASLLEQNVFLEKLGGDVPWAAVSAKAGTGVEDLLDLILLVAEIHDFKADPSASATGYVIEAHRDQKRGIAATLIITEGTLESGQAVLAGDAIAPVRIMEDHLGKSLKTATFSTPISLIGFDELPNVGENFSTYKNKRDAETARDAQRTAADRVPATLGAPTDHGGRFVMPVIIRADTTGSLEAIKGEVAKLGDEFTSVQIVQSGVGNISENDIKNAIGSTIPATVIGFHVSVERQAETLALHNKIPTQTFTVIYKLTEHLEELLKTSAPKRIVEEVVGKAKVIKCFSSQKNDHVLGGAVTEGYLAKKGTLRFTRRFVVLGTAKVINIQTGKQNVDKVESGKEFGMQIESNFEPAAGDIIEHIVSKTV